MEKEGWITIKLFSMETLICGRCDTSIKGKQAFLYIGQGTDIEEVLCSKCWVEEVSK